MAERYSIIKPISFLVMIVRSSIIYIACVFLSHKIGILVKDCGILAPCNCASLGIEAGGLWQAI